MSQKNLSPLAITLISIGVALPFVVCCIICIRKYCAASQATTLELKPPKVLTSHATIELKLCSQHVNEAEFESESGSKLSMHGIHSHDSIIPISQSFQGFESTSEVKDSQVRRHSFSGQELPSIAHHAVLVHKSPIRGHQSISGTPRNSDTPSPQTSPRFAANMEVKIHNSSSGFNAEFSKNSSISSLRKSSPGSPGNNYRKEGLRPSDRELKFELQRPKGFEQKVHDFVLAVKNQEASHSVIMRWPLKNTPSYIKYQAEEIQELEEQARNLMEYMNEVEPEKYEGQRDILQSFNKLNIQAQQINQLKDTAEKLERYVKESEQLKVRQSHTSV